jgi:biopolymer transport protein ExbD
MTLPGSKRRGKGKVELMMTPMIDIVFNLVIFFLLMPSFEAREGYLPTNLPRTTTTGPGPRPDIRLRTLRIDLRQQPDMPAAVGMSLNREPVHTVAELRSRLHSAHRQWRGAAPESMAVTIAPDAGVWHRHVVAAFDAAVDAGFKDIRFTVPK